jgi:probable rRNA maturation factor
LSSPTPPPIEVNKQHDSVDLSVEDAAAIARLVLDGEGRPELSASIALIDDATMADLNERYLGHEGPTDVIAFPLYDPEDPDPEPLLGEVIVSLDTALRQAPEHALTARAEALLYIVHGLLHLLGYDDHAEGERARMEARQQHWLQRFVKPSDLA